MVLVHAGVPEARSRLRRWHGLLNQHPLWHAATCLLLNPDLQLEDDQGHGILHVLVLLRLCGCFPWVRVRLVRMPALDEQKERRGNY